MSIVILGIDLGKNSCSVVGLDADGSVVVRRRMRRDGVIAFAAKLAPCMMAMEACCGAHHMGRSLAALGHEVRLMSPEYVRPYVKAQKNDDRDAEAIGPGGPFEKLHHHDQETCRERRVLGMDGRRNCMEKLRFPCAEKGEGQPNGLGLGAWHDLWRIDRSRFLSEGGSLTIDRVPDGVAGRRAD